MIIATNDQDAADAIERTPGAVGTAASMNSRELLFNTVQLVLTHCSFTTRLWQRQVARQQSGSPPVSEMEIETLRQDHKRAAKRLRDRCQSLLDAAKTPPQPSAPNRAG
jgi:hypothetical protein